jgi:hypothetical protein
MPNTEKLRDMLDNLVDGKADQAQVAFHDYLKTRLSGIIGKLSGGQIPANDKSNIKG